MFIVPMYFCFCLGLVSFDSLYTLSFWIYLHVQNASINHKWPGLLYKNHLLNITKCIIWSSVIRKCIIILTGVCFFIQAFFFPLFFFNNCTLTICFFSITVHSQTFNIHLPGDYQTPLKASSCLWSIFSLKTPWSWLELL